MPPTLPAVNIMQVNDYLPNNARTPTAFSSLAAGKSPPGNASNWKSSLEMKEENWFYEKLNESSSLTLPFSFRDMTLDLQQLYKNVTQRGGYHQVTKDGKWEDVVACSVSPDTWTPSQLKKIYATVLYQFEQTYHYRSPKKPPKKPDSPLVIFFRYQKFTYYISASNVVVPGLNSFTGKRKHYDGFYVTKQHFSDGTKTEQNHVSTVDNKTEVLKSKPDEIKEMRKDPRVPLGSRNCYQMFIKMEIDRLESLNENISSVQLRSMNEAWKRLSHNDKRTYIKASKKDKERYVREMAAYEEHKRKQRNRLQETTNNAPKASSSNLINHATHSPEASGAHGSHVEHDGDYHVALQPDDGDESALVWNESLVQMAVGLMKNAQPCDPVFHIEWD